MVYYLNYDMYISEDSSEQEVGVFGTFFFQ